MNSMSRRIFAAALPLMAVGLASAAHSQGNPPENDAGATLFENVRIFDGKGASLSAPSNVLIKGNIIERISTEPIAAEPGVTVIAGNGRTLMPGLIDAHWHAMLIRPNPAQAIVGDVGYNNIAAGVEATATRTNAELLALSGKRSPYAGKLGVVEQGALADLLLVEGNPLENIKLIADPAKNFKVIMKGGRIYKGCAVTTATSLAGPSQPMSRRDLTSAFGAKRKWTGRQSSLPRSKMTHNGSVAELSGARAQSFRHDCPPYLAFEFAGARTETFTSHRRLLHGKAGRAQEPQYS